MSYIIISDSNMNSEGLSTLDRKHRIIHQCIIVFATFTSFCLSCGFAYSVGVFYSVFIDVFQQSSAATAWIGSLQFGTLCATGPLASCLVNRYGCRFPIILGGVLSAAGLIMSAFAPNIVYLYVSFGILTGIGYGLQFIASVLTVGLYFDKRRTLAMGIAISGVSVGMMSFPYLSHYLVHTYSWRGALLLSAAVSLNGCVAGALIIPLNKIKKPTPLDTKAEQENFMKHVMNLFKNGYFGILCLNNCLYCFGMSVIFVHLVQLANVKGYNHDQSATLLSMIGISNGIGRVAKGVLGNLSCVDVMLLFIISYIVAGIGTLFYPLTDYYGVLLGISALFGFFTAAFGTFLPQVMIQIVGEHNFSAGYGIISTFGGTGNILGAPVAGWLYDTFLSYQPSFYCGGASLIISGLIMIVPWKFQNSAVIAQADPEKEEKNIEDIQFELTSKLSSV